MFRYNSGSGPAVMTGWVNVLFPYFIGEREPLYANPFLNDWKQRLEIDDQQEWNERRVDPQGIGIDEIPNCMTSVPVKVHWGRQETEMRLVGGLLVVTQDKATSTVEAECGWVIVYESPVDELSDQYKSLEEHAEFYEELEDGN